MPGAVEDGCQMKHHPGGDDTMKQSLQPLIGNSVAHISLREGLFTYCEPPLRSWGRWETPVRNLMVD